MQKYYMTLKGYEQLKKDLHRLKTHDRIEISRAIAIARAHGDLSENAEYKAAKEEQAMVETRIQDLENHIAQAEVIDTSKLSGNIVVFGAIVSLLDLDADTELAYHIVGLDEADIKQNKISINSPIARALIGKEIGDEVTVHVPRGTRTFEILDVSF